MSKTRDTGYLANVIQVHDTGVRIMSGSTMLMAVSSSGAVTITGEMSGSDAANALLLSGTGSVGFATTSSLLVVSSSQQQISSSYIALSGSYNTFSGSASTRTSQIENVYATTGSNSFRADQSITGSLVVSSTITAQTLVVQTVTSSIVYSSGSNIFGSQLGDRQSFTGSMNVTGSGTFAGSVTANNLYLTSTGAIYFNEGGAIYFNDGLALFPYGGHTYIRPYSASGNINFQNQAGSSLVTMLDGGNVCIGSTASTTYGTLNIVQQSVCSPSFVRGIELVHPNGTGATGGYIGISMTGQKQGTIQVGDDGATGNLLLQSQGGNVGIGTCIPSANGIGGNPTILNIHKVGSDVAALSLSNTSTAQDVAIGAINFASTGLSCTDKRLAEISATKANNCTNTAAGNLSFYTSANSGLSERMRITSGGNACIYCQLSIGPVVVIGNQGGTDTTVLTGGSGQGSALRMNYAGGCYNNFLAGNGDNYFNCLLGKLNAAGGVKFGNGSGTLNYYEQGTWTPRLKNGSFTTNAGVSNVGWYTRIGNLVTVGGTLDWGAGSGAQDGNSLQIACLPFASSNVSNERNVGQPGAPAANSMGFKCTGKGQLVLVNDPGNSFIYLIETFQNGTYTTYIHDLCVANAGTLYGFQITYHTL
jgi:hypothetical protein